MKKLKVFLLITILMISLLSFADQNSDANCVLDFEKRLEKHFKSYETNPRESVMMLGAGWVKKRYCLSGEYNYDVQRTNSLISPYTAICEFNLKRSYTDFHKTKEEAQKDNNFINSDETLHRHTYLFQKGKWNVSKRENATPFGDWFDCNEVIQSGENKGLTNIHGCWEIDF